MSKTIDLGQPSDLLPMGLPPTKKSAPKMFYPSVYINGDEDLLSLPDSGTMTVSFKVLSRTARSKPGEDAKGSIEIELHTFSDAVADASAETSTDSVLDTLRGECCDDDSQEGED